MGTKPGRRDVSMPLMAVVGYHLPPGRVTKWIGGAYAVPDKYVNGIRRAGGEAVLIAPGGSPEDLLERFDGLVLIGGGDVDPAAYGVTDRHPAVYSVDPDRDRSEVALVRAAAEAGVPTLAICRGVQVLNVAFGGTLIQHLPDATAQEHRQADPERMHRVRVADPSRLFGATGQPFLNGASRHHQGLDTLGQGLVAVGWADDELVEAVEHRDGWMLGVQWHPEVSAADDPTQQGLFDAVVREAQRAAVTT